MFVKFFKVPALTFLYRPFGSRASTNSRGVSTKTSINSTFKVHLANDSINHNKWQRLIGLRLEHSTIGIIGLCRIGSKVLKY